jgi:hypothetical protein
MKSAPLNIADQTKADTLNDETRDPARERSDDEPNDQRPHGLLLGKVSTQR